MIVKISVFLKHIVLLLILFCQFTSAHTQIIINEFSASNATQIEDPDYSNFADWIEIYNAGTLSQNLKGYYLSDNLSSPDKWQIDKNITIAAGEYLLLWADGNNTGIHANFKLSASGEEIGLYDPNLNILDSIIFSEQKTDVSFGRKHDGESEWAYFPSATPELSNTSTSYAILACNVPEFSMPGGFYASGIYVELYTDLGGKIYYTLDGSTPELSSNVYTEAIAIHSTTILRCRVFKPDCVPGTILTQSYFINENSVDEKLPVVSISTDPDNFWDSEKGIYVQDYKPDWEVPINIELFENNGSDRSAFNELAGAKINGLYSWQLPQKMLGVYFRKQYGTSNLDYPLVHQRIRRSYKNFALRASGSDWSHTLLRDLLGQQASLYEMDIDIMAYRPAIVYVNGEYMGIHNIREKVDDDYIEKSYDLEAGSFDLVENGNYAEAGDLVAFENLLKLLEKNLSIESNYKAVAEVMDIENFTDFVITEMAVANLSIDHNTMAWKPKDSGKWKWILMDLDRGFFNPTENLIDFYIGQRRLPLKELLAQASYKEYFAKRLTARLYTGFHPDRMKQLIIERSQAIEAEMPRHISRWEGTTSAYGDAIPSLEFWKERVRRVERFVEQRPAALLADLQNYGFSETANLTLRTSPEEGGSIKIESLRLPGSNWSGPYLKNIDIQLTAENKPGYAFVAWTTDSHTIISTAKEYSTNLSQDTEFIAVFERTGQCLIPEIIAEDLTLNKACSPYLAQGDIRINSNASLIIEPGVEIWMPVEASIYVNGAIQANGTSQEGILISMNPDVEQASWGGISFQYTDTISVLKYVSFEHASKGSDPLLEKAVLSAFHADLELDHVSLENINGNPIIARYSSIRLTNSRLRSKLSGDLINVKYGKAFIENCQFTGNNESDADAIDYDEIENGVIRNSQISNFFGSNSDAIDIGEKASNILIDSVTMYNIRDKGISLGQRSSATIQNSVFINCTNGIAVKDSSYASINSCVFYGNVDAVACFEKNPGSAGGNAIVRNSILSNASETPFYVDSKSTLISRYCQTDKLSDSSSLTNIIGNPQFENPSFYNFNLLDQSPAILSGVENGKPINIGTLTQTTSLKPCVMIYQIFVNPDSLDLPEFITLYNPSDYPVDLSSYAITKGFTVTIPEGVILNSQEVLYLTKDAKSNSWWQNSSQIIQWEEGKLSNNGESIQLEDNHGIVLDFVRYANDEFWPSDAFSGTKLLQLKSPGLDNHFPESWEASGLGNILDIKEANNTGTFTVFPNPTQGFINIKGLDFENFDVEVYNISGQLVEKAKLDAVGVATMDLSKQISGIYFIKIGQALKKIALFTVDR